MCRFPRLANRRDVGYPATGRLVAEPSDDVEGHGEDDAEQNRSCQRKVKGCVLAAIEDVAGEAAEGQIGFADEEEKQAHDYDEEAEEDQDASEIHHGISVAQKAEGVVGGQFGSSLVTGVLLGSRARDALGRAVSHVSQKRRDVGPPVGTTRVPCWTGEKGIRSRDVLIFSQTV